MKGLSSIPSRCAWVLVLWLAAVAARAADEPKPDIVRFMTAWGKQGAVPGEFDFPVGIAINASDEVFVTDHYNNRVQKFDADGRLLAHFQVFPHPGGIAVDAKGNLCISHFQFGAGRKNADDNKAANPDRISVYSAAGSLIRQWGKTGSGDGEFSWPGGVAIAKNGEVFVADQTNHRIQVFDAEGRFLRKWGEHGVKAGQFGGNANPKSRAAGPDFLAFDSTGEIFTTEASMCRVQKFTPEGHCLGSWGSNEDKPGGFGGVFAEFKTTMMGPVAIAADSHDRVWVSAVSGRIQLFSPNGEYLGGFGKQGAGNGEFSAPHGIAVNHHGQLYVVDAYNHRVQKFEVLR